jgi:translation initiation factor 1
MAGEDEKKPFNNPFAALQGKLGDLPAGPPAKAAKVPKGPERAVVRMERKGRGGKEVTVIEQLNLSSRELEKWLKDLKNGLGCGGTVEGNDLMLQGDQRERIEKLLVAKGVRKITIG